MITKYLVEYRYYFTMMSVPDPKFRDLEDFASISSDWFWETDQDHRFCYFSSRMTEVTGMPMETVLGRRRDAVPKACVKDDKWVRHIDDLCAHRPFRDFEYVVHRPTDGAQLWVRIAGQPIFDKNGTFLGYRGVGDDITREKAAIQKLEETNLALAQQNRELDKIKHALERTAYEDTLTGLGNRRAFDRDLTKALDDTGGDVGLMHIDVDRFKWVNDSMGHGAGDVVLVTVANRINVALAKIGDVYRVGGDEFMIITHNGISKDLALWAADTIVEAMTSPIRIGQQRHVPTVSIGFVFGAQGEMTPHQMLAYADVALCEAKRPGHGAVCEVTKCMQTLMEDRRKLAADLPQAITCGDLVAYFQPQIDADKNVIVGAEALVRWQHPELGLLMPGEFLDAAAALGLVPEIDRLVLEQALAAVNRLGQSGLLLPAISVNTSEARLIDPLLAQDIERLWTDRRCLLNIELLETIYFDDVEEDDQYSSALARLRKLGVNIETDDFGSGRASLTGLLKIGPDRLKIDRNLVKAVIADRTKRSLVTAILEMARALGIDVIAEGVETQEDIDAIRSLGCHLFQGYAIARPLCEADFADFLRHSVLAVPQKTKTADYEGLPKSA